MASSPPDDDVCDYVVVGSGPGGGTVAARLAEAGWPVTLALEGEREKLRGDAAEAAAGWGGRRPGDRRPLDPAPLRRALRTREQRR